LCACIAHKRFSRERKCEFGQQFGEDHLHLQKPASNNELASRST
jgi:hypothetical protein